MQEEAERALTELRRRLNDAAANSRKTRRGLAKKAEMSPTTMWKALREGGPVPSDTAVAALARALDLKQAERQELLDLRRIADGKGDARPTDEQGWAVPNARREGEGAGVVCRVLGNVPFEADCYVERPELRARLETAATCGTATLSHVLTGMGGVGKTQLAAHYAGVAGRTGHVDLVLWVTAASRDAVTGAYADAAHRLLDVGREDPQTASTLFLNWLNLAPGTNDGGPRPGVRWLVVLDDVPYTGALQGLWPPHVPHGQTLVTTRFRDVSLLRSGSRLVEVDRFTPEEAVHYLTTKLAAIGREDDPAQIAHLAEDLGRLPLALSQAVPFMHSLHLDCASYRERLASEANTLARVLPTHVGLPDDQSRTVAAAWDMSIELADTQPPRGLARPLLHVLSHLEPNGIPAAVLDSPPVRAYLAGHRTDSSGTLTDAGRAGDDGDELRDIREVLCSLEQFSLIDHDPDSPHRAVRMHQLVQRAVRERLTPGEGHHVARATADALMAAWPHIERDTDLTAALRANTAVLARQTKDALYQPVAHPVLDRSGASLGTSGQAGAARDYYQHLAEQADTHLGGHHRDTLVFRQQAARWQGEAGELDEAAAALTHVLAEQRRQLDPDLPELLVTRNSLAYTKALAGDLTEAVDEFAALLVDMRRVLGSEDRDTLLLRNNLARFRGEAGDHDTSVREFNELLADQTRLLGREDPDTLMTLGNLAFQLAKLEDTAAAATAFAEQLKVRTRVLGFDHPDTLDTRNNVAYLQAWSGDVAGAAAAFSQLVEDSRRRRGEGHPATLRARGSLALMWGRAGDAVRATTALADIVQDCVRWLGSDHPDTLKTWGFLAEWQGRAGDTAGSAATYAELLALQTRVLGEQHADTGKTRKALEDLDDTAHG
ncbi:FxSxx-COOH system tetratricopeptide repeat protein [Streptomyces sp. NPDC015139]|uniref:FxSxx-COOH system tetratricopeptide repeat protein n=1 Tax=Streptomyces sp. NPDC015139 TaxID=3364942 RepID=UPI0036FD7CAF